MNLTSEQYNPIHTPGSIQPHGMLLVLSTPELLILQVSSNAQAYLHIEPENLLGQTLSTLLSLEHVQIIEQCLERNNSINAIKLSILVSDQVQNFDALVHCSDNQAILELEPRYYQNQGNFHNFQALVTAAIATLQSTSELTEFLQLVTSEIQQITGFDRVMVYEFSPSGAGKVVAETKLPELPSYLDLHYPATDIPQQSRQLYQRCLLRFIKDINAKPVELIPVNHPATNQPLDLSLSVLRSADPCCVEYHQNMGVAALLVIPLTKNSQLWGLISCHHQTPIHLTTEVRAACALIGQFISLELDNKVNREELDTIVKLKSLQSELVASISQAENFQEALVNPEPRLLDLVNAQGAAVCLDNEITLVGITPTVEEIKTLLLWADNQVKDSLFCTDSLPQLYPQAETYQDRASGLLLLRISQIKRYYILWFRPEVIQTVNWAGNPHESIQVDENGKVMLSPRHSFAQWQEQVRFTSLPWKDFEQQSALDLRNAIVGIVLKKADELAQINQELQRSNQELDSFAFAASHDLKEPLRGIHNYSIFLLEDYGEILDEAGIEKLQTLVNLTERMEKLIDVLLKFSRLGQARLYLKPVNLNKLIQRVINTLSASRQDAELDIRIPRPLPTIQCDLVLVNELLSNLLSNGLKYNNKQEPWVEVGYLNGEEQLQQGLMEVQQFEEVPILFYVQDNGIGIRQRHFHNVFRLFKRLHSQNKYGGGTGAGLTIAKKIVERHGGRIWVESTYGEGSTFYFTLQYIKLCKQS